MRITVSLEILEISAQMMGRTVTVYPALIRDTDHTILVDAGYPGQLPLFQQAIERIGVPFQQLGKIIITHQDLDHIGSLPSILSELKGKAEVLASEIEQPYIEGRKKPLKLTPESIAQAVNSLPAGVPDEWRYAFKQTLENPPSANVHQIVSDGEELPYCGGIVVIGTPGHTPGHISLYHKASKTLIAADAMVVDESGQLFGPDPEHTLDLPLAKQSLQKLTAYDIECVICYHGGLFKGNANQRIAELADGQ
ncbi:MBL fold metallo-hydrolase [Paenibacillus tarimensis]